MIEKRVFGNGMVRNIQSEKGEVVRMTGHERDASTPRDDLDVGFPGSIVRGQIPAARVMLVGFAQCLLLMISLVLAAPGAMAQGTTGRPASHSGWPSAAGRQEGEPFWMEPVCRYYRISRQVFYR